MKMNTKRPEKNALQQVFENAPKLPTHEWRLVFGDRRPKLQTAGYHRWQLQEAKAKFSALFEAAFTEGPQVITRRNKQAVVVLTEEEYRNLTHGNSKEMGILEALCKCPKGDDLNISRDPQDTVLNLPSVFD